ncbi:hypothetical protein GQ457_01G039560 [Hibiscus cannabinus]
MEAGDIVAGVYSGAAAEAAFSPELKLTENFVVEDLLDFSNEDAIISNGFLDNVADNSTDSSNVTSGGDNHLSSADLPHSSQFSGELCVPVINRILLSFLPTFDFHVKTTTMMWWRLSNFVEDSFSTDQNLLSNLWIFATPESSSSSSTRFEKILHPAKARSKRSRAPPCDWSSRVVHPISKRGSAGRKCSHCATEKTPQWRMGPMGPKTLCNACGVRHKSGRLVPEYRPATSPTFVSTKHSNSQRKFWSSGGKRICKEHIINGCLVKLRFPAYPTVVALPPMISRSIITVCPILNTLRIRSGMILGMILHRDFRSKSDETVN